jgi:hypothetical protein
MADIAFSFDAKTTRYRPANAYWLGRFAQLAYRDANVIKTAVAGWGFGKFRFFDNDDTQAFVAGSAGSVIVAFRGTEPKELQDWLTDADCRLVSGPFGKVHDGFYGALREVWDDIAATISQFQDKAQSLWFTGTALVPRSRLSRSPRFATSPTSRYTDCIHSASPALAIEISSARSIRISSRSAFASSTTTTSSRGCRCGRWATATSERFCISTRTAI